MVPRASVAAIMMVWVAPTETLRQVHQAADEAAARRLGDDVAFLDIDLGTELLQPVEEEIDRPRADGTAAGQRHPRIVLRAPAAGR